MKVIKSVFEKIKNIILFPFRCVSSLFKKKKKINRIDALKAYIDIARTNELKIDIQVNYDNELIVNMSNFEKEAKRVRRKEKKQNEE